jgi:2-methylcitrate dehydratase PrpD
MRVSDGVGLYKLAFTDWLACASGGADSPAAGAVAASTEGLLRDVAFAGTAGHVLDYDDTLSDGVIHVSATCAPAALAVAAHLDRSAGEALRAYAEGYEVTAAVAAASHPALYDRGWHPTAVCGPLGAAVAAAWLLELADDERENAIALALLRTGGTRGAFGSDGKAIQVGLAAAAGVQASLMARAGARVDPRALRGSLGFTGVLGASWAEPGESRAIEHNWIKLHPSCLGTHSPIEAAARASQAGFELGDERVEVAVHPVARQAAHLDLVDDGLAAKFSIPYCVAHTFMYGPPRIRDFVAVDPEVRSRSALVTVREDASLAEFAAVLAAGGRELARIPGPRGAPDHPATPEEIAAKVADLAGDRLSGLLDDLARPAAALMEVLTSPARGAPLRSSARQTQTR